MGFGSVPAVLAHATQVGDEELSRDVELTRVQSLLHGLEICMRVRVCVQRGERPDTDTRSDA
jgi:hypothetical protein